MMLLTERPKTEKSSASAIRCAFHIPNLKTQAIMENYTIMGIPRKIYEKLNREYTRFYAHSSLTERPKRRRIPTRSELVYSTFKQQ